jgi:hypothetical protein
MSRCLTTQLLAYVLAVICLRGLSISYSEVLDIVHAEIVSAKMEKCILKHASMTISGRKLA